MHSSINVWAVLLTFCSIYVSAADISERQATCRANCEVSAGELVTYDWQIPSTTTTLTAATIIYSVDPSTNRTSQLTRRNSTFDAQAPTTNSLGTRVATKTFTINGVATTTILTFPTGYAVPPSQYLWYGTLFTSGQCSTVKSALDDAVVGSYASRPPVTQPPATLRSPGDPKGLGYVLGKGFRRDDISLVSADGAAVSCSPLLFGEGAGMIDIIDTFYVTGQIVISNGQTSYLPPTVGAPVTATAPSSASSTSRSSSTPAASSGADASFRRLAKTSMLDFDNLAGLVVILSMLTTCVFSRL